MPSLADYFLEDVRCSVSLLAGPVPLHAAAALATASLADIERWDTEGSYALSSFVVEMMEAAVDESLLTPHLVSIIRNHIMSPEFAEQLDTPILAEAPPSLSSVQKLMSVLGVLKAQERAAWLAHLFLPVARSLRSLSETFGAGGATLGLELGLDAASALEVHNRHRRQRSAASRTPASPATTFEHEYKTRQWLSTARRTQRRVSDGSETDTDEDTTPIFTFRSFFDASLVSVEPPKTRAVLEPLNSPTAATCSPRTRTTTAESLEEGEIVEEEGAGTALDGKRGSSPAVPCTPVRNISAAKSPCHSSRRPKSEGENIMPRQSFGISIRYHPYNRSPSVSPRRHNV